MKKTHFLILAGSVFCQIMIRAVSEGNDDTMPESIHTKDESKRGFAFAFIFGVN